MTTDRRPQDPEVLREKVREGYTRVVEGQGGMDTPRPDDVGRRIGYSEDQLDPELYARGRRALGVMEMRLLARDFFVDETFSLADIALVAYTRVAHEGGFDLGDFPSVRAWVHRVESLLDLPHADAEAA